MCVCKIALRHLLYCLVSMTKFCWHLTFVGLFSAISVKKDARRQQMMTKWIFFSNFFSWLTCRLRFVWISKIFFWFSTPNSHWSLSIKRIYSKDYAKRNPEYIFLATNLQFGRLPKRLPRGAQLFILISNPTNIFANVRSV